MPAARRRRRRAKTRKPKKAQRSFAFWLVMLALAVLLFAAGYLLGGKLWGPAPPLPDSAEETAGSSRPATSEPQASSPATRPASSSVRQEAPAPPSERYPPEEVVEVVAPPPGPPPPGRGVRLSLVIDDLGRSLQDLDALEALGVPVTYAVLPFEVKTPEVVEELQERGHETILHLPMEPSNGADPGPGALRGFMSRSQLEQATRAALAAVPGAVGVNNHMGSKLTTESDKMRTVLEVLTDRELFFLDSRTSAESVGYREAVQLGIPAAQRQVFLDGDPDLQAIRHQFRRWLDLARDRGAAIAIGHPHPYTLEVLAEEVPKARAAGYEFVPVSYLLDYAGPLQP
ncbi:MAG: divergent polysaccharide deacetylase family protein [Acidobacteriota bacterium]|nr:divergent polysaccharide deacetylase family protein [Acidobacteriota bacterium]